MGDSGKDCYKMQRKMSSLTQEFSPCESAAWPQEGLQSSKLYVKCYAVCLYWRGYVPLKKYPVSGATRKVVNNSQGSQTGVFTG